MGLDDVHVAIGCSVCDSNAGKVYIYSQSSTTARDWNETAPVQLTSLDIAPGDYYGGFLVLRHRVLVVGAHGEGGSTRGAIYVYKETSLRDEDWSDNEVKIVNSDSTATWRFGMQVAFDGVHIITGAELCDTGAQENGAIYIYKETSIGAWDWGSEVKLVITPGSFDRRLGASVGADTPGLLVGGAPFETNGNYRSGAAYVFTYNTHPDLTTDDSPVKLSPTVAWDTGRFGERVEVTDGIIAVAAVYDDGNGNNGGALYVFSESADGAADWDDVQNRVLLLPSDGAANDACRQVAIWNRAVLLGCGGYDHEGSTNVGAMFIYTESTNGARDWSTLRETKILPPDTDEGQSFAGGNIKIYNDTLVTGSINGDGAQADSGLAYVFTACEAFLGLGQRGGFGECIDDCASSPCPHGGVCFHAGADAYSCNCTGTGYTGVECESNIDDCQSSPCVNGVCTDNPVVPHEFVCVCSGSGFEGSLCQTDVDECSSSPCMNGICEDLGVLSFGCNCAGSGFEGTLCETDADDCASSPCMNSGACTDAGADAFSCDCSSTGYEGAVCQTDIDDCASSPCAHGGVCADAGANAFSCDCSNTGYHGSTCQTDLDDCASSPCLNGECHDTGQNSFNCDCADTGYEGMACNISIDECLSSPCLNAGTCLDGVNNFTCSCSGTGFEGRLCEIEIAHDSCSSSPCQNGATCTHNVEKYECDCAPGYTGLACELASDSSSSSSSSFASSSEAALTASVYIAVSFTSFKEGVDSESFLDAVPELLANELNASSDDFDEIEIVPADNGGFLLILVYANPDGEATDEIYSKLEASQGLEDAVESPTVEVSTDYDKIFYNDEPPPDDSKPKSSNEGDSLIVILIIVGVCALVASAVAAYYFHMKRNRVYVNVEGKTFSMPT